MSENYYTLLTRTGQAKIANNIALGTTIKLTHLALGDGNGSAYEVEETQTALRHEVYRIGINNIAVKDDTVNMIEISAVVPATVGGFTVREMGIFDEAGDLIAIAKTPEDPKPTLNSGAAKDILYSMDIIVTNADAVELKVDPTIIVATREYVDQKVGDYGLRAYKGFADVVSSFSEMTPLGDVFTAMIDHSVLTTEITTAQEQYENLTGVLTLKRISENLGSGSLMAGGNLYSLQITKNSNGGGV